MECSLSATFAADFHTAIDRAWMHNCQWLLGSFQSLSMVNPNFIVYSRNEGKTAWLLLDLTFHLNTKHVQGIGPLNGLVQIMAHIHTEAA